MLLTFAVLSSTEIAMTPSVNLPITFHLLRVRVDKNQDDLIQFSAALVKSASAPKDIGLTADLSGTDR